MNLKMVIQLSKVELSHLRKQRNYFICCYGIMESGNKISVLKINILRYLISLIPFWEINKDSFI